jgi:aspartate/methionine/tyrosine aminotransferase
MVPLRFSSRSTFDLSPNPLATALAAARVGPLPVFDLTESNPTRAGIPYDAGALARALSSGENLRYEPAPFGHPAARGAVARELARSGVDVDASRLVLTASTSEAYAFLFKLLCDEGDEVLVPRPSYPLFEHLARLESVRAKLYSTSYDGAWHIDVDSLRRAVSPRTRAIMTVSPNNPTGSFLKRAELDAIASIGLPIVSDEVFASYPLRTDAARATTVLEAAAAPLVFSLGGLSKLAALPQMKLAWTAVGGDGAHVSAALARLEVIADAFLSVGTPVQNAAALLFDAARPAADAIRSRTAANLAWLSAACAGSAVTRLDVEGGWYATLQLPNTRSEDDWTLGLVADERVYVHPGHFFDFEREPFVVLSLLTAEPIFREGTTRLLRYVDRTA